MDVDLLRPGTVPISKDTVLWFEFLLNPSLLIDHLANPNGDPTPTDLIMKLLSQSLLNHKVDGDQEIVVNGSSPKPKSPRPNRRSLALKIIALKIAAHLKWNMDELEARLPVEIQGLLFKDLLSIVSEDISDPETHSHLDIQTLQPHVLFAVVLYHRWVVRSYFKNAINKKVASQVEGAIIGGAIVQQAFPTISDNDCKQSVSILEQLLVLPTLPPVLAPVFETFLPLTEDSNGSDHKWSFGLLVPQESVRCQVAFELCQYAMLKQTYSFAEKTVEQCREAYLKLDKIQDPSSYCQVSLPHLQGLCISLGCEPPPPERPSPSLSIQFLSAVASLSFQDVYKLLDMDNEDDPIPLILRDCFELDISSEIASGKVTAQRDSMMSIKASNYVRRATKGMNWYPKKINPAALSKAVFGSDYTGFHMEKLHVMMLELLANWDTASARELYNSSAIMILLNYKDALLIQQQSDYAEAIPSALLELDSQSCLQPRSQSSIIAAIERQIISSYDLHVIRSSIKKLYQANPSIAIEKIYKNWEIPIPLHNLIMSLPVGMTQNYLYVMICKAVELDNMKSFEMSKTILRMALLEEYGEIHQKLSQLIKWELLLVDIHQFHAEWPSKHMDWAGISEDCLRVLECGSSMVDDGTPRPRVSLREDCTLALLNMGHWHQLSSMQQHAVKIQPPTVQLFIAIANACMDVKYNRKPTLDIMDKVLQVIQPGKGSKGSSQMTQYLCSIVDMTALTVVASLLARIHNILSEQPQCDLYTHLIHLWPNSIKNSAHYNVKWLTEMLWDIVNHGAKLYPTNIAWSKLLGDLCFASGHYANALKCYLEAAIVGTEYFSRPVTRTILEDHFIKKMIKSCINLQCHFQGAILCQYLEEVDYTTAFKALQEPSSWDAMDSYYECIWDVTILEFLISLHSKRNEIYRKQKAISMMGLLELNSNNNEEIKREAENIRKGKFLRALAKQYIC